MSAEKKQRVDYLERMLHIESVEDWKQCMHNAYKCVLKIETLFPDTSEFTKAAFRLIFTYRDIDLAHLIFFIAIPQVESFTNQCREACSDKRRWDRFLDRLVFCRTNLMRGLTKNQTECKKASHAHFSGVRSFVWEMREFYLMDSHSDHREHPRDPNATDEFNLIDSHKYPCVGTTFNMIMAMFVDTSIDRGFKSMPFPKKPVYGAEATSPVQTFYHKIPNPEKQSTFTLTLKRDCPEDITYYSVNTVIRRVDKPLPGQTVWNIPVRLDD